MSFPEIFKYFWVPFNFPGFYIRSRFSLSESEFLLISWRFLNSKGPRKNCESRGNSRKFGLTQGKSGTLLKPGKLTFFDSRMHISQQIYKMSIWRYTILKSEQNSASIGVYFKAIWENSFSFLSERSLAKKSLWETDFGQNHQICIWGVL